MTIDTNNDELFPMHAHLEQITRRQLPSTALGAALIGSEEEELLLDVIRRKEPFRYYGTNLETPPPMAAKLEEELCAYLDARYALAVCNGTSALEVALGALGIGSGDEVILPVWSWDSCFTSIMRSGATPVLAEIDQTLCLDPAEIPRLCTPRTKAVMIVHYQGVAADMEAIMAESRKAGIKVLEDCAESPGVTHQGQRVGTIGDIGIFSFQYAKSMTCGEGGAVVTNDPVLYERSVRMHDLGKMRPYHEGKVAVSVNRFCGGQYRMTELQAAVALAQLRKLETLRERCRRTQAIIMQRIGHLKHLQFRSIPDPIGDSGFEIYFWLEAPEQVGPFIELLEKWGVATLKGSGTTCHYNLEYCQSQPTLASGSSPFDAQQSWPAPGYQKTDFPKTEQLIHRFIAVPLGVLFTDEDADYIGRVICGIHDTLLT